MPAEFGPDRRRSRRPARREDGIGDRRGGDPCKLGFAAPGLAHVAGAEARFGSGLGKAGSARELGSELLGRLLTGKHHLAEVARFLRAIARGIGGVISLDFLSVGRAALATCSGPIAA